MINRFGPFEVDERATLLIRTPSASPVQDETGTVIPGSSVDACTLTLYNVLDGEIINSRGPDQDILGANGGAWLGSGEFSLLLDGDDNQILDDALAWESHVALVEYTYNTDRSGKFEAVINVRNLVKVPE